MLNRSFWHNRKVFLTGHTGFKGSWLSMWLEAMGARVTGYALDPPTAPSLFEQARVRECIHSIRGDVRDFPRLKAAVAECDPDVIIHMAAQSVVRSGYEEPVETYSTNVMGTVHLLEAVRQLRRPCVVVNVTSDKCYANQEWVWGYRESDAMGGHDPYSNSKGCAELVTSAYRDSYFPPESLSQHGVALASVRAGNAIGGGDWTANQLVPDLIRAFIDRKPCRIRSPCAIRPWQFVLIPLHGYLLLCEKLAEEGGRFASGWNFGPADGDAKPVSWIADRLTNLWGDGALWTRDGATHPAEAQLLRLDTSKARAGLDWRPVLRLDQSLVWITEWYREFQAGKDLQSLTRRQIERYEYLLQDDAEQHAAAARSSEPAGVPLLSMAEG
ncbi:CDP-glucose 4,6-dehydratase [Afipia sp. TerB]